MTRLIDVVNSPWALPSAKLGEIVAIYCAHVRGEKLDLAAIESRIGPLANEQTPYEVRDGVAIISVDGVLAKRMNMMSRISGGASTELIGNQFDAALADPRVTGIVLAIDSPGGAVDGTQTLADKVFAARGVKPVVAWGDGSMTSGAMWIGSAASEVYISGDTVITGSIGVAMQHVDVSKSQEKMGVKTTDIYSGKYKRIATENGPLTADAAKYLQTISDQMYSVFVDSVARNRNVSTDTVLQDMADGRLFVGRAAIEAGLVDGVSTLDQLIADMVAGKIPGNQRSNGGSAAANLTQQASASGGVPAEQASASRAGVAQGSPSASAEQTPQSLSEGDGMTITRETLNVSHAALVEEILAEGRAQGATAERDRIQSVEAQALPGHAELINALKFDGKTTGDQAAARVLAAERQKLGVRAADLVADAAAVSAVAPSASAAGAPSAAAADTSVDNLPLEERCKATWDKDAKVQAEFGGNYAAYLAFEKANAAGNVRILTGKRAA